AGYRVRRVSDNLVLAPSDSDDDIIVAVRVEDVSVAATVSVNVLGWLRGSDGKLPQFYHRDRWIVPLEALRDLAEIPGKEKLEAMSPYQEPVISYGTSTRH